MPPQHPASPVNCRRFEEIYSSVCKFCPNLHTLTDTKLNHLPLATSTCQILGRRLNSTTPNVGISADDSFRNLLSSAFRQTNISILITVCTNTNMIMSTSISAAIAARFISQREILSIRKDHPEQVVHLAEQLPSKQLLSLFNSNK